LALARDVPVELVDSTDYFVGGDSFLVSADFEWVFAAV
jgi:hypothetical protein